EPLLQRGAHVLEVLHELDRVGDALFDDLAHGEIGVQQRLLGDVADLRSRVRPDLAVDVLVDAGHDLQEGGLARAVAAEDPDLGAVVEREAEIADDDLILVHLVEVLDLLDEMGHARSFEIRIPMRDGPPAASASCRAGEVELYQRRGSEARPIQCSSGTGGAFRSSSAWALARAARTTRSSAASFA